MGREAKKTAARKIASWSIVAAALAGAFAISSLADVTVGAGITSKLFVFFLGAVIVMQIVPGVMLLVAMCKGICSVFSKSAKVKDGK